MRHMWQPQQQRGPHCNVFWTNSRVNTFFCLRMRNNLMITLRVIYWLINSYWTFLSKMHWKYYLWYYLVIYSVKLVWYVYDMQGVKHLVFLKCSDFSRQFWLAQAWRTHTDTEGNGRLRVLVSVSGGRRPPRWWIQRRRGQLIRPVPPASCRASTSLLAYRYLPEGQGINSWWFVMVRKANW